MIVPVCLVALYCAGKPLEVAPKARDYSVIINNDVVLTISLNARSLEHHCNFVSIDTTKLFASSIRDY